MNSEMMYMARQEYLNNIVDEIRCKLREEEAFDNYADEIINNILDEYSDLTDGEKEEICFNL